MSLFMLLISKNRFELQNFIVLKLYPISVHRLIVHVACFLPLCFWHSSPSGRNELIVRRMLSINCWLLQGLSHSNAYDNRSPPVTNISLLVLVSYPFYCIYPVETVVKCSLSADAVLSAFSSFNCL